MTCRAAALTLVLGLVAAAPAAAAPDRTTTLGIDAPAASWNGATATGLNTTFYEGETTGLAACTKDPQSFCETTLVQLQHPKPTGASLVFRIDGFRPVDDFDLRVYRSNAQGAALEYLGNPTGDVAASSPLGTLDPRHTFHGDFETKTITNLKANGFYLVEVVYFSVPNGSYKGSVKAEKLPAVPAS